MRGNRQAVLGRKQTKPLLLIQLQFRRQLSDQIVEQHATGVLGDAGIEVRSGALIILQPERHNEAVGQPEGVERHRQFNRF